MVEVKEKFVDGQLFQRLILSAAANLKAHAETVDDLNVFPIPDGDTGENMCMTLSGGLAGMKAVDANSVDKKAKALSEGMLLNARGNSGVILSQLFRGLADGFTGVETANLYDVANAFHKGVECAYTAVVHPVEGTILTVAREAAEYAAGKLDKDTTLIAFFENYLNEMKASLSRTPDLLAVLKEAGVIDSGGAGLVYIAEGMLKAVKGKDVVDNTAQVSSKAQELDFSKFTEDSVMQYGYCTEFLLRLQNAKTDVKAFTPQIFIDYLSNIGDSIVAFMTGTIVKVHVHTMTPYKVLEFCQRYGEFLTIKIENMTLQHNDLSENRQTEMPEEPEEEEICLHVEKPKRKFGLVTVATGAGIINAFRECGADVVIDGGQGKNPSIEDFIKAFDEANSDHIFVLPNNGNIIMAAKQAASLYTKSEIIVIESKNLGQAYSALTMLDYSSDDPEKIANRIREDMTGVVTGMITRSIRSATVNGVNIADKDYIGFTDKTMLVSVKTKAEAFAALADRLGVKDKEFLIVIFGESVSDEDKKSAEEYITKTYPNVEYYSIDGGQEIYDYILILE